MSEPFSLEGVVATYLFPNTDTDVIIPARFLKRTAIDGFEPFAFFEKRYLPETECEASLEARDYVFKKIAFNPDNPLNHPHAKGATFLLTWDNFGCGSSREHAVYALNNFRVILGSAPAGKSAFADIFRDNCRQNLIWTPVLDPSDHQKLVAYIQEHQKRAPVKLHFGIEFIESEDKKERWPCRVQDSDRTYLLSAQDPFEKARLEIEATGEAIDAWAQKNQALLARSPQALTR